MRFCHYCGAENPENPEKTELCSACGKHLLPERPGPKKDKEKTVILRRIAGCLCAVVMLGAAVVLMIRVMDADNAPNNGETQSTAAKGIGVTAAANSVLYLEVYDDGGNVTSTASGFIIGDGKTLVTNYHVIDNAYKIIAHTPAGERSVSIEMILASDRDSDLAVLQCKEDIGVTPLTLRDSDEVKQGDNIFAVGYPLGLAHTMSDGIVSSRYADEKGTDLLQITAPISSGSSGGALLDENGKVVGVICAYYTDGQNLNLAVSSNTVTALLQKQTPKALAELYVPTYSVAYVLANQEALVFSEFYVCGWVNTYDYTVTQESGTETVEGWATICDDPNLSSKDNCIRVNYRNVNGVRCEALESVSAGDCLRAKVTVFKTADGFSVYGDSFEILQ